MKRMSVLVLLVLLSVPALSTAQPVLTQRPPAPSRSCYTAVLFTGFPGIFGGCSWGNRFGAGLFGGVHHLWPPVNRFAGDAEAYGMVRGSFGILNVEMYLGIGADAPTESGSARAILTVGTAPGPVGLFFGAFIDYYPRSLNFGAQAFNAGQFDGDFRIGPKFRVIGSTLIVLVPWIGVGFADSRRLDQWAGHWGCLILFPF